MKTLKTIIQNELRKNEKIYILRENELADALGIMHELTIKDVFNNYNEREKVVKFWHEDGLCIILK